MDLVTVGHVAGYVAFAGVVALAVGLAGTFFIIDQMVKRFVTKADWAKVNWSGPLTDD